MPSLCSYDKGTKGFEGRRYSKDIAAAHDAQERFFAPIKATKKKLPRFVMLQGNHEYRIERAIDADAAHLDGVISPDDLLYERSEEHTSEIQTLISNSYAVFCLKQKQKY